MAIIIHYLQKRIIIDAHYDINQNSETDALMIRFTEIGIGFESFLQTLCHTPINNIILTGQSDEKMLHTLQQYFKVIEAGGGIVTDPDHRLLFIFRRNKWDLPKGKIENGESLADGAKREIEEETGLQQLNLVKKIYVTYHLYELHGDMILKPSHWYHFTTESIDGLKPQTEEDITDLRWFATDELHIPLSDTYENIITVTDSFLKSN